MSEVKKTQREIDRIARTAENFELRQETPRGGTTKYFISGPKDDKDRIYWPEVCLMHHEMIQLPEGASHELFKITGNVIRFMLENGHGLYHILGHYQNQYIVLSKISSSVEHAT